MLFDKIISKSIFYRVNNRKISLFPHLLRISSPVGDETSPHWRPKMSCSAAVIRQTCNLSAFQFSPNETRQSSRHAGFLGSSSRLFLWGPSIKFARKKTFFREEISVFCTKILSGTQGGEKRDVDLRDGASVVLYLFLCGQLLRLKTCNGLYLHLACWLSWSLCQWQCQQRGSLTSFGTLRIPCKFRVYHFIFQIVT